MKNYKKIKENAAEFILIDAAQRMFQKVLNQFDRDTESVAAENWIILNERKAVIMMGW